MKQEKGKHKNHGSEGCPHTTANQKKSVAGPEKGPESEQMRIAAESCEEREKRGRDMRQKVPKGREGAIQLREGMVREQEEKPAPNIRGYRINDPLGTAEGIFENSHIPFSLVVPNKGRERQASNQLFKGRGSRANKIRSLRSNIQNTTMKLKSGTQKVPNRGNEAAQEEMMIGFISGGTQHANGLALTNYYCLKNKNLLQKNLL